MVVFPRHVQESLCPSHPDVASLFLSWPQEGRLHQLLTAIASLGGGLSIILYAMARPDPQVKCSRLTRHHRNHHPLTPSHPLPALLCCIFASLSARNL